MRHWPGAQQERLDAIILGLGLAGLSAGLELANHGKRFVIIEKEAKVGGNSMKASSGINGAQTRFQDGHDTVSQFLEDTVASGKGLSKLDLAKKLTQQLAEAVHWLADECGVDLSVVTRLGGHSNPRTHRGSGLLPPGFAIISAIRKKIESEPTAKVMTGCKVTSILTSNKAATGVRFECGNEPATIFNAKNVIIATGGYSADTSGPESFIAKYRPDIAEIPTTNGKQTTGDGLRLAAEYLGANLVHLDQVQVHPTGFYNVDDPSGKQKFLCGELIRGIGGYLISPTTGQRFTDELSTRDHVTLAIKANCALVGQSHVAAILVSGDDYPKAKNHIDFYVSQGLMFEGTVEVLAGMMERHLGSQVAKDTLQKELDLSTKNFDRLFFGFVTPAIHFTMGGIEINENAQILDTSGEIVRNAYAVGEASGGTHGGNRLAGSSLLECVVFGREAARHICEGS